MSSCTCTYFSIVIFRSYKFYTRDGVFSRWTSCLSYLSGSNTWPRDRSYRISSLYGTCKSYFVSFNNWSNWCLCYRRWCRWLIWNIEMDIVLSLNNCYGQMSVSLFYCNKLEYLLCRNTRSTIVVQNKESIWIPLSMFQLIISMIQSATLFFKQFLLKHKPPFNLFSV
jgi:hypothetical protein